MRKMGNRKSGLALAALASLWLCPGALALDRRSLVSSQTVWIDGIALIVFAAAVWAAQRRIRKQLRAREKEVELLQLAMKQQRALQESEAKFRAVAETETQAIYIHDGKQLLYANKAAEVMSGYSFDELMKMDIWQLTHPDSVALMKERFAHRQRGEKVPSRYEYKFIPRDGSVRWGELSVASIEYEGQRAFLCMVIDITERKQSEQLQGALYRIAEKTSSAIDLQQFYAAVHGILDELMYAKNFYIALFDGESETISFAYSVDEEDSERQPRRLRKGLTEYILRTGRAQLVSPERFDELVAMNEVESVGAPSVDWLGAPLRHRNVTFGALVVQSYTEKIRYTKRDRDILSFVSQQVASAILHKRDQDAIRQSETRYRSLVESAVYGIYRSSADGQFLEVNRKMVSLMGYDSAEEMYELHMPTQVYFDPQERSRIIAQLQGKTEVEGVEVTWRRKDETPISLRLSGRSVVGSSGIVESYEMIVEDVTDRRLLEEQLRQSQKMDAVGRLAGGVAHDFNNLLTVIKGYSDILLDDFVHSDPKRSALEEIKKSADRAASLTSQLLAFSRQQVTAPKVLDFNESIRNMENMLRRLLGIDVELVTDLDVRLGRIKADTGQIEQVIMNLAVNARDAMPGGGTLTVKTENVSLDASFITQFSSRINVGEYVLITVTDTGAGIDEATQSRIFEPFFTTKELGKGTGLGLSTVYGIVKQSGGHVSVNSAIGRGARFDIYLPRVNALPESVNADGLTPDAKLGCETVLVVEDDEALRGLVTQILSKRGYKVLQAADPASAVEINSTHRGPIQLFLTDLVLRQMNGHELAKKLTASRPGTRVLFMSGYTSEAVAQQGMLEADVAFLQKPFTTSGLARKVREVLDHGATQSATAGSR
ncbi:MAG: multi-sensor hybrid histidine kinase [Acidobacteriaceae bacterium]|nr:multi-sensor hybrid histidine kinase [Acidobacteriaceae bacterium]